MKKDVRICVCIRRSKYRALHPRRP